MDLDLTQALMEGVEKVVGWAEAVIVNLPEIVAAGVVVVLAFLLAGVARRLVVRVVDRLTDHGPLKGLAGQTAYVAVLAGGIFVALGILELDRAVTSLLAGVGILGLALGFAFQDIAQNFISGILLTVRRPFTDGDLVRTGEFFGRIEGIDLRATRMRTLDGQLVRIPNGSVYGGPITNYSQSDARRVDVACGVTYGDDLEEARRVALEAAGRLDGLHPTRAPEFFYTGFGGSSIDFVLRLWLPSTEEADYLAARSEAVVELKKAFDAHGVDIPFPIMTLDFSDSGTRQLDAPLALLREPAG